MVVGKDDINKKFEKYLEELKDIVTIDNKERFSREISRFDKNTLLTIRRLINGIKECETEFILSKAFDYLNRIDSGLFTELKKTVQERIDFINLKEDSVGMLNVINNDEVVEIIYQFIKTKITIMDLEKISLDNPRLHDFTETVKEVQNEIKNNVNKTDLRIVQLDQLLQEIFEKLNISDLSDIDELTEQLKEALEKTKSINEENKRLSEEYGGSFAFVKTYKDFVDFSIDAQKEDVEVLLELVYDNIKEVLEAETIIIQGKTNFVDSIKKSVTIQLLEKEMYGRVKPYYDKILGDLYTNIQLFK